MSTNTYLKPPRLARAFYRGAASPLTLLARHRTLLKALCVVVLLLGVAAAVLILLVRHEPEAYRRAHVEPGPVRARCSKQFYKEFSLLISAIKNRSEYDIRLTDEEINSYLAEGFIQSGVDKGLLPEGISEPRLLLEPGKVRLAFRYGSGLWSTVVSLDFAVWLVTKEPNVVALELQGLHAGALPVGAHYLLDSLSKAAARNGIEVNWYRRNGNPVALLRFQGDQSETTVQLRTLQIDQGSIIIQGGPVATPTARANWGSH